MPELNEPSFRICSDRVDVGVPNEHHEEVAGAIARSGAVVEGVTGAG